MRILVLGGGGREAALAWSFRRHGHEVIVDEDLVTDGIDLVVPGSEAFLADGVADECLARGVPCFGPTADLAQLETSKAFARHLATSLGIPGPRFEVFDDAEIERAIEWWQTLGAPVVVKADGLAAGKGVVVPDGPAATVQAIEETAGEFLLEERLTGPECSLLVICSGRRTWPLPLAQDHKRIGEGDSGPNTGGMGAYAPAPVAYSAVELTSTFVQPVLDHFADLGTPFVGVLYAGLMLTSEGPRLIEYNVRFGDPEAQAVLPLVEGDLAEVLRVAATGAADEVDLELSVRTACAVVAAAPGYPVAPRLGAHVFVPSEMGDDALLFPAGMRDGVVTGGRVLAVTGLGDDLAAARRAAYDALEHVVFEGMQVRRDIGWRAPGATLVSYAATGVDIDEGTRAVAEMRAAVERTHGESVVRGVGSFGGVFSLRALRDLEDPVLVASTDGVGTKVELAARLGRVRGVGMDIVHHCIDDVLVQGAVPLFFLDYIAASRLDAGMVADVVGGMAEACEAAGCALLGGETAEMPGVYLPGAFDIAGTLVGVADGAALLPTDDVGVGDLLVGVASSGPHTNGYSLLRRVFEWASMDAVPPGFDRPLGDALLEPHRNYLPVLGEVLREGRVKALAHITGGGLPENLPRVLPGGVDARVHLGSWPVPPLFRLVQELTPSLPIGERYRTLNMGIGMVVVCAPADLTAVQTAIPEETWVIGELVPAAGEHPEVHLVP